MVNIDIVDSFVNLIDVDLKDVTISNVDASMSAATSNSGASLASSHASGATAVVSDFSAPDYDHGWIYAAWTSFTNKCRLWRKQFLLRHQAIRRRFLSRLLGANAVFDTVTAGNLYVHRTAPSTFKDVTATGSIWFRSWYTFSTY